MSKAEESYKYASNSDKYDSEIKESVSKKALSKKDANTVNKIQEMMRKEKEEQRNKKSRQVVTSENRKEFMENKLGLDKPHGIFHKETEKIHSHYPSREKAHDFFNKEMGSERNDHAIGELTSSERKEHGYK